MKVYFIKDTKITNITIIRNNFLDYIQNELKITIPFTSDDVNIQKTMLAINQFEISFTENDTQINLDLSSAYNYKAVIIENHPLYKDKAYTFWNIDNIIWNNNNGFTFKLIFNIFQNYSLKDLINIDNPIKISRKMINDKEEFSNPNKFLLKIDSLFRQSQPLENADNIISENLGPDIFVVEQYKNLIDENKNPIKFWFIIQSLNDGEKTGYNGAKIYINNDNINPIYQPTQVITGTLDGGTTGTTYIDKKSTETQQLGDITEILQSASVIPTVLSIHLSMIPPFLWTLSPTDNRTIKGYDKAITFTLATTYKKNNKSVIKLQSSFLAGFQNQSMAEKDVFHRITFKDDVNIIFKFNWDNLDYTKDKEFNPNNVLGMYFDPYLNLEIGSATESPRSGWMFNLNQIIDLKDICYFLVANISDGGTSTNLYKLNLKIAIINTKNGRFNRNWELPMMNDNWQQMNKSIKGRQLAQYAVPALNDASSTLKSIASNPLNIGADIGKIFSFGADQAINYGKVQLQNKITKLQPNTLKNNSLFLLTELLNNFSQLNLILHHHKQEDFYNSAFKFHKHGYYQFNRIFLLTTENFDNTLIPRNRFNYLLLSTENEANLLFQNWVPKWMRKEATAMLTTSGVTFWEYSKDTEERNNYIFNYKIKNPNNDTVIIQKEPNKADFNIKTNKTTKH